MFNFEEGAPYQEGVGEPHVVDREALFALLAASGVTELALRNCVTTMYVDSTPKAAGELYLNADGEPVYGFMTKFSDGFTGWKQGDLVRARFVVRGTSDDVALQVADSYVGDSRHADRFVLDGEPEQLQAMRMFGITELDVDVRVTSAAGQKMGSNMSQYRATIDRINSILEAWDGKTELTPGQVLLQGKVLEYVADRAIDRKDQHPAYLALEIDGRRVVINLSEGHMVFEGGPYEKLLSENPQTGDVVQVLASYDPSFKQERYSRQRVSAFDAHWCRSAYCLTPSAERRAQQEAFQLTVDRMINQLESIAEPSKFRRLYGQIIDQTVIESEDFVRDCRTVTQARQMERLVEARFGSGANMDKPLLAGFKGLPMVLKTLRQEFGIDVHGMSVAETYDAAMKIARNPSALSPKVVNTDYLFWVLEDALSPEQMSKLATNLIENYYPAVARKRKSFDKEAVIPRAGEAPSNYFSITESAIFRLSQTGLDRDLDTLTELFEGMINNDQFSRAKGEDDLGSKIIECLEHALSKTGAWTIDAGWQKVLDVPRLKNFTRVIIPRLTATMGTYTAKVNALTSESDKHYAALSHGFTLDRLQRMVTIAAGIEAVTD